MMNILFFLFAIVSATTCEKGMFFQSVVMELIKEGIRDSLIQCKYPTDIINPMMTKIGSTEDLKRYVFEDNIVMACLSFVDYQNISLTLTHEIRKQIHDGFLDIMRDRSGVSLDKLFKD